MKRINPATIAEREIILRYEAGEERAQHTEKKKAEGLRGKE